MTQAAILIPCLLTGGTEVATLETAQALQDLGQSTDVVVYFDEVDATMLQTFASAGIAVHCLGLTRNGKAFGALHLAWRLLQCLRKARYDLIWVQYMTPTLVPLLVARFFVRRLVATVHVASGHYSATGRRRLRWLARHLCDRFVCVSQTSARGIFGKALDDVLLGKRVLVLPNALDMAAVNMAVARDWRRDIGLADGTRLIGFVGRLTHNKGVDILLRAAAQPALEQPQLHWIIVGDGADRSALEALAKVLGVSDVVHFVGAIPREGVYAAFKGFEIAVVPSREEGFGLSALEAMACGVPLVASRVDALQEVVLDGVTGLLCPAEDPAALADGLARLVSDAGLRQAMGSAGVGHVARLYDAPTYRANLAELLVGLGLPVRDTP
jgi:glycosyltransferase involved in cell wall biosynthesis